LSRTQIDNLDAEAKRQILEFGLRLEVTGYMVFHGMVDLQVVNDLGWRYSWFLVAREELVGGKAEAQRSGRVFGMV